MLRLSSMVSLVSLGAALVLGGLTVGCADTETGDPTGDGNAKVQEGAGGGGGSDAACDPGTRRECDPSVGGTQECIIQDGDPAWGACTEPGPTGTPLVLVFDDAPVSFVADATRAFDLTGVASYASDWPTARTPWLALDRDGDGRIADGGELFGSATRLASGARATNGFEALAELDSNGDGRIDARDARFGELVMWSDANADRSSAPGELARAAGRIVSIDLAWHVAVRCDARNNCERETASFRYVDAAGVERTGRVVDVHLALH